MALFSRNLSKSELSHLATEKEANSIIEAIRRRRYYITGKHFTLITYQKSVSYMFDKKRSCKIKNDKSQRWGNELGRLNFNTQYRPLETKIFQQTLFFLAIFIALQ